MLSWTPSGTEHTAALLEPSYYYQDSSDLCYNSSPSPSPSPSPPHFTFHQSMPTAAQLPPTVRVHQSTPSPSTNNDQSMLTQSAFVGSGWGNDSFPGAGYLYTIPRDLKRRTYHKRKSSGSSVASAGPPSPLDHTTVYPQIANSDLSQISPSYDNFDFATQNSSHTSKPLPSRTSTPASGSFMTPNYQNLEGQDKSAYANMRRLQTTAHEEDVSYAFSAPPSVSTMSHNSPATPHTNYENDYDDQKNFYQGYQSAAYTQSMQDVFPDQMFGSATPYTVPQAQQPVPRFNNNNNHHMSPHRSVFANRLQAANQDHISARTNSPVTSVPRDQSPFRQDSPFVEQARMNNQRSAQQMNTVSVTRTQEAPKSVSPKELMLDEHDIDEQSTPLFPDQSNSIFSNRRESSNMSAFQSGLYNNQYSQNTPVQIPQQYPFVSQNRQESSHQSIPDQTPEFPAHLASMESTVEEGGSEPSSQLQLQQPVPRPDDTSSDAGTYTCTYHGCTQRFETPAQLQKHKREGHRQASPATAPTAQSIALRNSQAGPHKCERINPSTGKPCNSVFSRPYDLTRHEDTIHNARKQKVRCHLCTEEKTFSRNDALTRHMRVVHPDVDWPGKTRRKNGRE